MSGSSLGPNTSMIFTNEDTLVRATGANVLTFYDAAVQGTGLPRLACTRGPMGVLYTGTTKADVITRPRHVVDLCARMGLASIPE